MKVFCPEHRKSFLAPRRNPVRCENKDHTLGELDFDGQAKEVVDTLWQYCCNCEHFWPFDVNHRTDAQCPVCSRNLSLRYLCDRCYTITCESANPAEIKNFTLTADGVPQPSCPGCLEPPVNTLREHHCDELSASFITALTSCPFCSEVIGDAPAFPATVAAYLAKVKAYKTVAVDYERNLLVASQVGEFVLVPNGTGANQPIILPWMAHLTSKRDFYQNYQDYYICENPNPGEVFVISPAVVEKVEGGWRLTETGRLEVLNEEGVQSDHGFTAPLMDQLAQPYETAQTNEPEVSTPKESELVCSNCGTPGTPPHSFCWSCGHPFTSGHEQKTELPQVPASSPPDADETVSRKQDYSPTAPTLFGAATERQSSSTSPSSTRSLIAIGIAVFAASTLIVLLLLRHSSSTSVAATNQVTNDSSTQPTARNGTNAPTQAQKSSARPEDDEVNRLRESVASAPKAEKSKILEQIASAEKKYPNDYRFPYERAKLSIRGTHNHDDAFSALFLAAEKAINNGTSDAMLNDLNSDEHTDLRKLSKGHDEWKTLQEALKARSVSTLRTLSHH